MRLLGMINFAGKYLENKSEMLEPLTGLLKKEVIFTWGPDQEKALSSLIQQRK